MSTTIKLINKSLYPDPSYATTGSAGMDIRINIPEESFITIQPLQRVLAPTGLFVEIPEGKEIQIRPRSGIAWKHGISVLNSPGTIDSDFRGEIHVILVNLSDSNHIIKGGERIAQMVLADVGSITWDSKATLLSLTERGGGGFGHTGI